MSAGGSLFAGDINRHFAFKETKPATGIFYRLYLCPVFSLRSNFNFTNVSGSDSRNESFSDKDINYKFRNLHFRSRILEFNIVAELFFRRVTSYKTSPYIFAGGGLFYFNPQAKYQDKWYDLQPLNIERANYSKTSQFILVGTGIKYKIKDRNFLSFEMGFRRTFTDYIDDVSGTYYDKALLFQESGSLAAILSDRSGDLVNNVNFYQYVASQGGYISDPYSESGYRISGYGTEGDVRGNPKNKDHYIIYCISFSHIFK